MSRSLIHAAIRPLFAVLAVLAVAVAAPADAAIRSFTGFEMNDTPPPAPGGGCAMGQVFISFSPATATVKGESNFGSFKPTMAHCLTPPPKDYSGGKFDFTFDAGDMIMGSYSGFFGPTGTENVLNTFVEYIVTGGTGRFAGASGTIHGEGILDRTLMRPINNLALTGVLDMPAVPEPATWGLMITGFGMVGAMVRRRRLAST